MSVATTRHRGLDGITPVQQKIGLHGMLEELRGYGVAEDSAGKVGVSVAVGAPAGPVALPAPTYFRRDPFAASGMNRRLTPAPALLPTQLSAAEKNKREEQRKGAALVRVEPSCGALPCCLGHCDSLCECAGCSCVLQIRFIVLINAGVPAPFDCVGH